MEASIQPFSFAHFRSAFKNSKIKEDFHFHIIRLHREALKQSATDPLSGKIDVGILTTGLSTAARKKRAELVASIKEMLKKKGKVPTVSWPKLFQEIKDNSQIVSIPEKCIKTKRKSDGILLG